MLKNYLKIAYRNLMKNKIFSLINIFGLAFGIAVCILIFQYVALENSYDKFHLNKENIYRITLKDYHNNELEDHSALIPRAIGHVLLAELPEIKGFARMHEEDEVAVTYN